MEMRVEFKKVDGEICSKDYEIGDEGATVPDNCASIREITLGPGRISMEEFKTSMDSIVKCLDNQQPKTP